MSGKRVHTGAELGRELKRIGKKFEGEFDQILQNLTLEGFRELVQRSAKDFGFLRSNWDVTTGTPNYTLLKADGGDHGDATPPAMITTIKAGDKVILYNNTEYAQYLEHGTDRMRSQPMIEPTYQMLLNEAKRLLGKETKRKVA